MSKQVTIDDEKVWICQYCGEKNSIWLDLSVPGKQDFIEDCRVCCRPNRIIVLKDKDNNANIEVRPSDE